MSYSIPEGYTKRELFARPTAAELRHRNVAGSGKDLELIARSIASLGRSESYCISADLLRSGSARYCKKNDPVLDIPFAGCGPAAALNAAFRRGIPANATAYGWRAGGPDRRLRVVPFVKLLEGARILAYEANKAPDGDAAGVRLYGDSAAVQLTRRRSRERNHTIVLSGVPMREGDDWRGLQASSCCEDNLYSNLRSTGRSVLCGHHVAAYWKTGAAHFSQGNDVPMDAMHNPFPVPGQEVVDFYKRLGRAFVAQRQDDRVRYRLPNEPEMGRLLVAYMKTLSRPFVKYADPALLQWA
jgi:hypothetical protein